MITGEIKNRIDAIWDSFWTGGITNPVTVMEQMTYLFFMKLLDDTETGREKLANLIGVTVENPIFPSGNWTNPEDNDSQVPYEELRWSRFKHFEAERLFRTVRTHVFPFIKQLQTGEASAYSRFMQSAIFLIPNARTLVRLVEQIDALDMNNRDAMGDVYEYILGKMAASGTNGQFRTPRHIIRMMVELMQPTPRRHRVRPCHGVSRLPR